MRRELHVRFCEGGGVQLPSATRLVVGFEAKADADRFRAELIGTNAEVQPGTASRENAPAGVRTVRDRPTGRSAEKGNRRRSTFSALRTSAGRRGAMDGSRCCGRRFANGCRAKLSEVKTELKRRMHDPIPEVRPVAAVGRGWTHSLLRSAYQPPGAVDVSVPSRSALASHAVAAQPERPRALGPDAASDRPLAASRPHVCHPYPLRRMGVIT